MWVPSHRVALWDICQELVVKRKEVVLSCHEPNRLVRQDALWHLKYEKILTKHIFEIYAWCYLCNMINITCKFKFAYVVLFMKNIFCYIKMLGVDFDVS